jgi:hypothetical protein
MLVLLPLLSSFPASGDAGLVGGLEEEGEEEAERIASREG